MLGLGIYTLNRINTWSKLCKPSLSATLSASVKLQQQVGLTPRPTRSLFGSAPPPRTRNWTSAEAQQKKTPAYSFWMLKSFRISSGDLPLIMLATVLHPTSLPVSYA